MFTDFNGDSIDKYPMQTWSTPIGVAIVVMPVLAVIFAALYLSVRAGERKITGYSATMISETALTPFLNSGRLSRDDYENLGWYFETGFEANVDRAGSSAHYRGLASNHGDAVDRIEGFTRVAPLLAVLLTKVRLDSIRTIRLQNELVEGLTNGSDPASSGYWGVVSDNSQLIVEASDVALTIWLLKDSLWLELSPKVKLDLVTWLLQVNKKAIPDNNWHLFITYINLVVRSLGYKSDMAEARLHYERFHQFYRGSGWFSDGPGNQFDYYNSWGIEYQLFWIDKADPSFDHGFISSVLKKFSSELIYLVGPNGIPIMGRSICYRMAVVAPIVLDQMSAQPSLSSGVARRSLRVTWSYFIKNKGVYGGNITQGYCAADRRLVDSYSGPASCLWGLRSLIGALYLPRSNRFWTSPEQPLPVEVSDYSVQFPELGWTVRGTKPDVIVIERSGGKSESLLKNVNPLISFLDIVTGHAHRPDNHEAKYGLSRYRSDLPFCGCSL